MLKIFAQNSAEWRSWLRKNANTATEVWLVYYKKNSGKASIQFSEALDEALCIGWVDTKVKSLDAARYMMRFAPRRQKSSWSPANIARMNRLIAQRRTTTAGRKAFEGHEQRRTPAHPSRLPNDLERRFKSSPIAWQAFLGFPPGYRRMTIGWVASAKARATKERRLARLMDACARKERLEFI
jgi:uncharacterized protein YdeI (YjbR/CyaY-like superfamily)